MCNKLLFISRLIVTGTIIAVIAIFVNQAIAGQNPGRTDQITAIPRTMTYQARLTDSDGQPLADQSVNVTFKIYNDPAVGSELWSQLINVTTDSDGLFSTELENLNLPFDEDYWLELTVEAEVLDPRQRIGMVGYAAVADTADFARNASGGGWVDNGSVISLETSTDSVGIGTDTPTEKLHVEGNLFVSGTATIGTGHVISGNNNFVAGTNNTGTGNDNVVSGGADNIFGSDYTTIAGGGGNIAGGQATAIAGGMNNNAASDFSAIGGGYGNTTNIEYSFVGGGLSNNVADGPYTAIAGGHNNYTEALASAIGGGEGNQIVGAPGYSAIGGGFSNFISEGYSTIGGGRNNSTGVYSDATIGGGSNNHVTGNLGTISGGYGNTAEDASAVAGGQINTATGMSFVGGGENNSAITEYSTVAGGYGNHATEYCAIGGGAMNNAMYDGSTIPGGKNNTTTGLFGTIAGGSHNRVDGNYSFTGGGYADTIEATGDYSYLFGIGSKLTQDSTFMVDMPHVRFGNEATGYEFPESDGATGQIMATDGAGLLSWTDPGASGWVDDGSVVRLDNPTDSVGIGTATPTEALDVVGNIHGSNKLTIGVNNTNIGDYSVVCGNGNYSSGVFAAISGGGANQILSSYAAIAGGRSNAVRAEYSIVGGGIANGILNGTCTYGTIAGGEYNSIESGADNTIGGGSHNVAQYNSVGRTISGGEDNTCRGQYSTIGGGFSNWTVNNGCTIAGGASNTTNSPYGTIGGGGNNSTGNTGTVSGGLGNNASGTYSSIGGGFSNTVGGDSSTVSGGSGNQAVGNSSVISGGRRNYTGGHYSSILGGAGNSISSGSDFSMVYGNGVQLTQFYRVVFFNGTNYGGLGINRDASSGGINWPIHVGTNVVNGNGAYLTPAGVWFSTSDKDKKENFAKISRAELFEKIGSLEVESWQYKNSPEKHIGPYAQEFNGAFGTGAFDMNGDYHNDAVSPNDVAGVALAGVKELIQTVEELKRQNAELAARVAELEAGK